MSAQTRLGGESLAADVAVKWTVLGAFYLGVVVPQVLLQVRELDEGASTFRQMTLVGSFAWTLIERTVMGYGQHKDNFNAFHVHPKARFALTSV